MESREIELVQKTFARAVKIGPHVAATFYSELFAIEPAARALFKGDMVVQGEKLMSMLSHIVTSLANLEAMLPTARELAVRHVTYGVEARHYVIVGTALLRTLRHELGPELTPEARAAWASAYQALSDAMCEAAYGASRAA
jgi:hemoglobin-like flavoprotein